MKSLYVQNSPLVKDKRFTFLTTDIASGASSLSVQSIIGFESLTTSSGQILLIGDLGREKSEIIKTSTATGPTGTTVTLASNTVFDHPQDTKVYIIDWDRVDVQWASTATGTKSTIRAYPMPIQADAFETLVNDTTQSSGYYFTRFNETIGNSNTDWSDPVPFAGYGDNTVFAIKKRALDSINEVIDPELITHDFLNKALWQGRREYHQSPGKRPFRRKFNVDIGNVSVGMYRIVIPDDAEKPHTSENIYGVRIGPNPNMGYYDKKSWDFDYEQAAHTTLTTAYSTGDQDLYLSDVRDFDDSGDVQIENDTISYSARGVSGGTLRISAAGSTSHAISLDVWQGKSFGLPNKFTVFGSPGGSAYIYFSCPLDTAYVDQNIYADYYRTVVDYDSDADVLDEPNYDMFVPYLAYQVKKRKARGAPLPEDPDLAQWILLKDKTLANEYLGAEIRINPDIDHLLFTDFDHYTY